MKIYKINSNSDFEALCKAIEPSKAGINLMRDKASLEFVFIDEISSPAANILKQEALSVSAELVTNKNTILVSNIKSKALLIGTKYQLAKLAKKCALQDFGLKKLAEFLNKKFVKRKNPEIMGVINVNDDSFNAQSRANITNVIDKIETMILEGADYVDIGAVSSRPGSEYCQEEEEFRRLKSVLDEIYACNIHSKVKLSLDSFSKKCLKYALDRGFVFINDISADVSLATLAKEYNAKLCIMHMKGIPKNMQDSPHYDDLLLEISEFFATKIEYATNLGAKDIVLDVGIGFGKNPSDNIALIKHLQHFLSFQRELLVGASRKSVIDFYHKSEVKDRLSGSLFLHLKAYENGANIIRTHDVREHKQLFALSKAMDEINLW